MKKIFNKHWSNILFIIAIISFVNPTSKEWLLKTIAFSPSLNSEPEILSNYSWELKGLNTIDLSFSDLKGKVVFVNFWATWCPPCRAEIPAIQNLYDGYKNDVAFVFVSQESREAVISFFKAYNYDLPVYNALNGIPKEFKKTNSIPATYVLNKKGEIVIDKVGAAAWDNDKTKAMIDELLQE